MIRLIGILTGSALAIALLILTLGFPEIAEQPDRIAAEAPVAEMIVASATEPASAPSTAPVPEAPPEPVPEPTPEPEAETRRETAIAAPPAAEEPPLRTVAPDAPPAVEAARVDTEQNWYAFWSPFRSEIAADGFVSELQRTTGLDYRIVKLKPGIYEVAFAYSDDADIEDKLLQISAATGLDMSGG